MAKAQALAVQNQAGTDVAQFDYGDDVGFGFENTTRDDYLMPMLDIIQPNSAEMSASEGNFRAGQMIIRSLGETFEGKKGVAFVPAVSERKYVEWRPKDAGGGVAAQYNPDDDFVLQVKEHCARYNKGGFGKLKVDGDPTDKQNKANDLVETVYLYGVLGVYDDGADNYEIVDTKGLVIPFTSTKISAYRGLMTKARVLVTLPDGRKVQPPLYAHRYRLRTKLIERAGNKWFNYDIGFDGANAVAARIDPTSALYDEARALYQVVREGLAKVDTKGSTESDVAQDAGGARASGGGSRANSEDIPF